MNSIGAGCILQWEDHNGIAKAYLVYPDLHIGRIMTGIIIIPDCSGYETEYIRTFGDKLSEEGYKIIILQHPSIASINEEWIHSNRFLKWREDAIENENILMERIEYCKEILKKKYEIQRIGILGIGYGSEIALKMSSSFDSVAVLSPTSLPNRMTMESPTLIVLGDRNEYIDSKKLRTFMETARKHDENDFVITKVIQGQRHGFAVSRIADEDAATIAIAYILDWFVIHLHRFRTALCTSDGDPWWPQGKNGPFYNVGLGKWQAQRTQWTSPILPRPPKQPPVPSELIFEGLSSMKRTFELPHSMSLADVVEVYVDIWDINQ